MENKISVVINTYNAERYLKQVLESVREFDEIVICDMESTDTTVNIAKEYNCKIVSFPKKNNKIVEPARQFAIETATNPWVLVVDADEIVPPKLRKYLYDIISTSSPCSFSGLYIPRRNIFMGHFLKCLYPDPQLRFFQKKSIKWPPIIHANPKINGKIEKIPTKKKELAFIHLDANSIYSRVERINRYTEYEIEKRGYKNYGILAMFWRPFFRFFKRFIISGGIFDGKRGFIYAYLDATYQFVSIAKILEQKKGYSI